MWLVRLVHHVSLVHMLTNCQKQLVKRFLMTAGKVRGMKISSKYWAMVAQLIWHLSASSNLNTMSGLRIALWFSNPDDIQKSIWISPQRAFRGLSTGYYIQNLFTNSKKFKQFQTNSNKIKWWICVHNLKKVWSELINNSEAIAYLAPTPVSW